MFKQVPSQQATGFVVAATPPNYPLGVFLTSCSCRCPALSVLEGDSLPSLAPCLSVALALSMTLRLVPKPVQGCSWEGPPRSFPGCAQLSRALFLKDRAWRRHTVGGEGSKMGKDGCRFPQAIFSGCPKSAHTQIL